MSKDHWKQIGSASLIIALGASCAVPEVASAPTLDSNSNPPNSSPIHEGLNQYSVDFISTIQNSEFMTRVSEIAGCIPDGYTLRINGAATVQGYFDADFAFCIDRTGLLRAYTDESGTPIEMSIEYDAQIGDDGYSWTRYIDSRNGNVILRHHTNPAIEFSQNGSIDLYYTPRVGLDREVLINYKEGEEFKITIASGNAKAASIIPYLSTPAPVNLAPTATPEADADAVYREILSEEQKVIFDELKDKAGENFNARFLTEQGFTSYLAFYDKGREVAFVWNFEQGKLNPALKIENNLLVNETSGSHIIWNPALDRAQAQKTLADYFRYARARVIAGATGVQLGNTLDSALGNPTAQGYLSEGRNVTLLPTSRNYINIDGSEARFNVPAQNIFVSGETPIVFRTVQGFDENMVVRSGIWDGQRFMRAYSIVQNSEGVLFFNYFSEGPELLPTEFILARRVAFGFHLFFGRGEDSNAIGIDDSVTESIIFNGSGPQPKNPLAVYSQTR